MLCRPLKSDKISSKLAGNQDVQKLNNLVYQYLNDLFSSFYRQITQWGTYEIRIIALFCIDTAGERGNSTSKYKISVPSKEPEAIDSTSTWYIRDAQYKVVAVYERGSFVMEEPGPVYSVTLGPLIWKEQHLYGSSRLGMRWPDTTVSANPLMPVSGPVYDSIIIGSRIYELTTPR